MSKVILAIKYYHIPQCNIIYLKRANRDFLFCFFYGDLVAFKGIPASVGALRISLTACSSLIFAACLLSATSACVGTTQTFISARTTTFLSPTAFAACVLAVTELYSKTIIEYLTTIYKQIF